MVMCVLLCVIGIVIFFAYFEVVIISFNCLSTMGVPVFFKWMCMRNPKMLKDAS